MRPFLCWFPLFSQLLEHSFFEVRHILGLAKCKDKLAYASGPGQSSLGPNAQSPPGMRVIFKVEVRALFVTGHV